MRTKATVPWVRTRLMAAPAQAVALGLLVLVTSFLAAVFPRAVDTYETQGLRQELKDAGPAHSGIEITHPVNIPVEALTSYDPEWSRRSLPEFVKALPPPLATIPSEASSGIQSRRDATVLDDWLPKPEGEPAAMAVAAQSDVARHARLVEGRMAQGEDFTLDSTEAEAVVTVETARTLKIKPGSVLHFATVDPAVRVAVKITGVVEPLNPQGSYWSFEPTLRAPALAFTPAMHPHAYWRGGILLAPEAAPIILRLGQGAETYVRLPTDIDSLHITDLAALQNAVASLEAGPAQTEMRKLFGPRAVVFTDLGQITGQFQDTREAIAPVVAVAVYGIGAVALIVLLMTGALAAARRSREVALLRARGGSVRGITGRICAETAVVALPAAALGWLLAALLRPEGRLLPSLLGAGLAAVLACGAIPVRAVVRHLRLRAHGGRDDLAEAKPSRRRTVAELTALVLAVGAVVALRRRGSGEADALVSAAPVMVALIAALLLVRVYPLPLRIAGRPLLGRRGAIGFLSLARASRTSSAQALPLLALLVALTTAAFGGSVLAGVSDARDQAAVQKVGADLRISGKPHQPLPEELAGRVRGLDGVQEVSAVYVDAGLRIPGFGKNVTLIAVDPESYARLSARTGTGAFSADELTDPDSKAAPALASPKVAEVLGRTEHTLRTPAGRFTAEVVGTRERTPASFGAEFLLVDAGRFTDPAATALFVTGDGLDREQVAEVIDEVDPTLVHELRTDRRAALADAPLQNGAETVYGSAVAAGAGYAVLAVLLSLLQSAPERTALVARLRTMGLGRGQARRLLVLEALPQALLAAGGGILVALAAMELVAPGLDLGRIALTSDAGVLRGVRLRMDSLSLLVPAASVVLLATGVALVQAWWTARQTSLTELRAGDGR
ncbi:ABC transporter permease [Streptomyces sp. KLOTTS4A1]|uniref:ABC transporter permease n=1 Tax=Streptomyces sp. KLOTTS4A1 TaxID=3390996 RepID=UPI0039F57F86